MMNAQIIKSILTLLLISGTFLLTGQKDLYKKILEDAFSNSPAGATAIIVENGETVYTDAVGKAHIELDVEMETKHIFRLGSITKQFTSVAIMMLEEEGKLKTSDLFTKYIPEYPIGDRKVTIAQLLNHTSGIKSYTGIPGFMQSNTRDYYEVDSLIDVFEEEPFDFEPGDSWSYNNSGYILLGAIIERVSEKTYAEFLQENIFRPLGMKSTFYDNHEQIIKNRIPGYSPSETMLQNANFLDMSIPYAAGSLLSDVEDLAIWNKAVFDGKLISKASMDKIFKAAPLNDGTEFQYGFGWGLGKIQGKTIYEHGGGIFGFLTQGIYAPDQDVYVAVLSNCNCAPPSNAANRLMAAALGNPIEREAIVLKDGELEKYVGTYDIEDAESKRFISLKDGKLYSQRDEGRTSELFPFAKDKFAYSDSPSVLEFVRKDGKIVGQNLVQLSGESGYAKRTSMKVEVVKEVIVAENILKSYVGKYELDGSMTLLIKHEDGKLKGGPEGQPLANLIPRSETEFAVPDFGVKITFKVNDKGECEALSFVQGETTMEAKKIE